MFEKIYKQIKKAADPIYIWGAGSMAQVVLARLTENNIPVAGFFIDQQSLFAEQHDLKLPLYTLNEVLAKHSNIAVVVGHGHMELTAKLEKIPQIREVFIIPNPYSQYYLSENAVTKALNGGLATVKKYLADDTSYKNLELYYRLYTDTDYQKIYQQIELTPIFSPEFLMLDQQEIFFDVGAFYGDTVEEFISQTKSYKKIVAFEIDKQAIAEFKNNFGKKSNIMLEEVGLGSKKGSFSLERAGTQSAALKESAGGSIAITTLDDYVRENKIIPSLLKIAVPQLGLSIIQGAVKTLAENKIKLIIDVGVAINDDTQLIDTIYYLKKLNKDYKIALRYRLPMPTQLWLYAY